MLSKITRIKLVVFALITVAALSVTAMYYIRLPQQLGFDRYNVSVDLNNAGGLYPQAMVTYRGVEVGKVTGVDLGTGGSVIAHLQIDNGVNIPANSTTQVRSASVIGEQYINFLPSGDDGGDYLHDGSIIPVRQTSIPTSTNALLSSVNSLLQSVPLNALSTTADELDKAFTGTGTALGQTLDASATFQKAAEANLPATLKLIDDAQPVLSTQHDLIPSIRSFSGSLNTLTAQLANSDSALRGVLTAGTPFMDQITSTSNTLKPVLPSLLSDTDALGNVLNVYTPALRHLLIVAPAELNMMIGAVTPTAMTQQRTPANLWFKLAVNPPTCTQGWADANKMRNPDDFSSAPPPATSYCQVPQNSPLDARGARNYMCPNGNRGASALQCGYNFMDFSVSKSAGVRGNAVSSTTSGVGTSTSVVQTGSDFLLGAGSLGGPTSLLELLKGVAGL